MTIKYTERGIVLTIEKVRDMIDAHRQIFDRAPLLLVIPMEDMKSLRTQMGTPKEHAVIEVDGCVIVDTNWVFS